MMENWEEWLTDHSGAPPFRGTSTDWRNGQTGTWGSSTKGKVLYLGRNNLMCQYMQVANLLESSSAKRDLDADGHQVEQKPSMCL